MKVKRSKKFQILVRHSRHSGGINILFPREDPEDRFLSVDDITEIIEIPIKSDDFDYTDCIDLVRKLEEHTDGLPISDLLCHIIGELLKQRALPSPSQPKKER